MYIIHCIKQKKGLTSECDNSVCKTNFSKKFLVEWSNDCCLVFFVKWQKVGCYWKIFKSVFCFLLNALHPCQLLGKCCKGNKPCFKGFFSKKANLLSLPIQKNNFWNTISARVKYPESLCRTRRQITVDLLTKEIVFWWIVFSLE